MTNIRMSPNHREVLSAISTISGKQEYLKSTNNALNVNASVSISGSPIPISGATTAIVTAIVDSSGNQISTFGGGTQYAEGITTSPATGTVALGRYNTSSPTLTNGQLNAPQLDVNGNLKVNIASGGGSGGTSSSFSAAFPATGTAIGATDGTNMQPLKVDGSDNLLIKVNNGTGTSSVFVQGSQASGAALAGNPLQIGSSDGSNLNTLRQPLNATNNNGLGALSVGLISQFDDVSPTSITENNFGNLRISANRNLYGTIRDAAGNERGVNVTSANALVIDGSAVTQPVSLTSTTITGTVAVTQSGTWNINNISGTVSLPTGASTETTLAKLALGQGSTTSGQSGSLIQGAVTTAAPTYTTAQTSPLSLDTAGNLRTSISGTVTVSATNLSTNIAQIAGATTQTGHGTASGSLRVELPTDGTGVIATVSAVTAITNALPPGTNAIGKLSANSGVIIGDVNIVSAIPGTGATALGKAEDAAHASGDTGVFALGVRNDGAATAFSGTNGDYTPIGTDAQGRIYVVQKGPTATLSNVSSSATNVTILAANTARIGAQFYNDSTQILYLKFGTTASTTSFTVALAAATYYELPAGYTGNLDGLWASANGAVRVTEVT